MKERTVVRRTPDKYMQNPTKVYCTKVNSTQYAYLHLPGYNQQLISKHDDLVTSAFAKTALSTGTFIKDKSNLRATSVDYFRADLKGREQSTKVLDFAIKQKKQRPRKTEM